MYASALGLIGWLVLGTACYQDASVPVPQAATDMLITMLDDRDAAVRLTAAEALGKIGDEKASPLLLRALEDSDPRVREAAARSMGRLSVVEREGETQLLALLRDPEMAVRQAAAQALGARGKIPASASDLAGLLTDPDPTIRQAVGHALLLVDGGEAFTALFKGTRDRDAAVRQWVVAALGETGDSRAVPLLLERLRDDPDIGVRTEAAYRLRFIGDSSVLRDLEKALERENSRDVKRWVEHSRMDLGGSTTAIERLN